MPGIDNNTVLMLHADGIGGNSVFTDDGVIGHVFSVTGTASVTTAQAKFGKGSLNCDGTTDGINAPNSTAWNVFATTAGNVTIDCFVRLTTTGGGNRMVCTQGTAGNDQWTLNYNSVANAWQFAVATGGNTPINMTGGSPTITAFQHLAVCRVGSDWGLYVAGNQVSYVSNATTGSLGVQFTVGYRLIAGNPGDFFPGQIDELRITNTNYFSAAPTAATTNTITVPVAAYERVREGSQVTNGFWGGVAV